VKNTIEQRLDGAFGRAYRHVEILFDGHNPYMAAIGCNLRFLDELLKTGRWPMLRRRPPVYTVEPNPMAGVRSLMLRHLEQAWDPAPTGATTPAS